MQMLSVWSTFPTAFGQLTPSAAGHYAVAATVWFGKWSTFSFHIFNKGIMGILTNFLTIINS